MSKRITGYINWQRNRAGKMDDAALERLLNHLHSMQPDHIAVTGDLVNLALDEEIRLATHWLHKLGTPEHVSVVPGNHDTYVPGALKKIIVAWRSYMSGDDANFASEAFPYRRDRGPVALIGINSGRASLPFMATGSFKPKQQRAAMKLLQQAQEDNRFRVVMIHHPPFAGATSAAKRLIGAARFRRMIQQTGAELILHGHTHIDSFQWIEGPSGKVPVIGVPAASHMPSIPEERPIKHGSKPHARYNLFDISGQPGTWNCNMSEYGFQGRETHVRKIAVRSVLDNGQPVTISPIDRG